MNLWGKILHWLGWEVDITAPRRDKCVICVAPHTSNWDFIYGLFAYRSLGRKANFLIKKAWFIFPMNLLMKSLGGIPVNTSKKKDGNRGSLTQAIIEDFKNRDYLNLAVTPEGTRKARSEWRTGFLRIAHGADVPIQLGVLDFKHKKIIIRDEFYTSGNLEADMAAVKSYYADYRDVARYPSQFEL